MTTLTQASAQWASRPADERFVSLTALHEHALTIRRQSASKVVSSRALECRPAGDNPRGGIEVFGANGVGYAPTHHAFAQLAARANAPAAYLRTLPAPIACDALNYGYKFGRQAEDVGVLIQRAPIPNTLANAHVSTNDMADSLVYTYAARTLPPGMRPGLMGDAQDADVSAMLRQPIADAKATPAAPVGSVNTMRAVTGPRYGRVWNHEITRQLTDRFGDGVSGDWRVPGEFGKSVDVTRENTTLYASDRDMFVFLADEVNRVKITDRRNGESGSLARGFFVWNSEVGDKSLGVAMFLFDYACRNRIVWGARGFKEIKLRHTVSAPDRWLEEVAPVLNAYHDMAADPIETALKAAQAKRIDDLDAFLASRNMAANMAAKMSAAHMLEEGRPIETLWDATTALTAHAKTVAYQDERVALERMAGSFIDLAQ